MVRRAPGFTLVEVLVAVGILALVVVNFLMLMHGGVQGTSRNSELELATITAGRVMDRLIAGGYGALHDIVEHGRPAGDLDLSTLDAGAAQSSATPHILEQDGMRYAGKYVIDEPESGLVRVRLTLAWTRPGAPRGHDVGTMDLIRCVAAGDLAMDAQERLDGEP